MRGGLDVSGFQAARRHARLLHAQDFFAKSKVFKPRDLGMDRVSRRSGTCVGGIGTGRFCGRDLSSAGLWILSQSYGWP